MAFPVVATTSSGTGGSTSTAITMPSGVTSGDLLVVMFGVDGVPTVTHTGTGWTQYGEPGSQAGGYAFVKIADGADTLTVNYSVAEVTGYYVYRITGAHASTVPEADSDIGSTANPDSPNLAPSWGAEDTMWISFFSLDDGTKTLSSYPTNYADNQNTLAGTTAGVRLGIATRNLNASSENPGSFTVSASDSWVALTIAVRPAAGGGGSPQDLTPSLFTNTQTFYAPTVTATYSLLPGLLDSQPSFFAPAVTVGAVDLAPSLLTNSQTFYAPTVSLDGAAQNLDPPLLDASASIFAPVVSSSYGLSPWLLTNGQTFYAPAVSVGAVTLSPPLLTNSQTFYAATITGGAVITRAQGLRKTRYVPGRVPSELKELARFLQSEIERITDGLESPFTHQLLEKLNVEPSRKPGNQALICYADGTNWNPGSGEGIYAFYGGAWHLLG